MTAAGSSSAPHASSREYASGLARAFGGALIFSLPILMTMEMWSLGFTIDRFRLMLFLVLGFVLLVGLSRFGGFEKTASTAEDALDALAAVAVGALASATILAIFGVIAPRMSLVEITGKIAMQTMPAAFGALIARKQLGGGGGRGGGGNDADNDDDDEARRGGYGAELLLMLAGALFLAFNMAPTEEMVLIAYKMTPARGIALILLSVGLLHLFVYSLGFAGQEDRSEGSGFLRTFATYSLAGYGIAAAAALYVLWTFGRTDGLSLGEIALVVAVLGFPAAIGAAIARLVV